MTSNARSPEHVVVVAHRWPPATGGGPLAILRSIISFTAADATSPFRGVDLVIGGVPTSWADSLTVSSRSGSVNSRFVREWRELSKARRRAGRLSILQFEFPRASALFALRHPRSVRLVFTEHSRGGVDMERRRSGRPKLTYAEAVVSTWIAHRVSSLVVWPSRGAIDAFYRAHKRWRSRPARDVVVYNGVDVGSPGARSKKREPAELRVLIIATNAPDKRVPQLLDRLSRVSTGLTSSLHVTWVGGGETRRYRRDRVFVDELGMRPRADVIELLQESELLLSWPAETIFDLSVLEAMQTGVIPVVPPQLGFREALGDDYPFFVQDDESLAGVLETLTDANVRQAWGAQVMSSAAERFTVATMTRGYWDAIRARP